MQSAHTETRHSLAALTLGAIGVVYGDIGTSPLYAFREALAQSAANGISRGEIIGILSLALWALIVVVTLKYVLFLSRMDNNGEGGVLSLMALAKRATGGRWLIVLLLGAAGAALFYGDAIITPALSVLSAVEGLKTIPGFESMYSAIEEGVIDLDADLKERISQLKTKREIAEASLEQIASNASAKATITPQKVSAFTELMRDKLRNGDVRARKDWLGAVLDRIEVGDDVVKIVGNKQVLAAAVTGQNTAPPNVRGFVRKWRARQDSNLLPQD